MISQMNLQIIIKEMDLSLTHPDIYVVYYFDSFSFFFAFCNINYKFLNRTSIQMSGTNPYYTQEEAKRQPNYQQDPYFQNKAVNIVQPASNQINAPNNNYQNGYYQTPPQYVGQQPYQSQPYQSQPYQSQPAPPTVIVVNQRPHGRLTRCQRCIRDTQTYIQYVSGTFVFLMCFIIFLLTCCCFFIAFWVDQWKDKYHRCSNCHNIKFVQKGGC